MEQLTEKKVKELFDGYIDDYASGNQYSISKIPFHTHNGTDSPLVSGVDTSTATTTRIRVYKSAFQTIGDSSWTKIEFNSETFDTLGEYDNATNYRFTATTAGYYAIYSQVLWNTVVDTKLYKASVYKNNAEAATGEVLASGTTAMSTSVTDLEYLAIGDYIEIFVWQNGGGNINTYGGTFYTYLTITKL